MTAPRIQRLMLRSFRSVPVADVVLDNPTILVGRNGAGKSNVIDAFAFLAEAMTSPLSAVFDRRGGIGPVRNRRAAGGHPSNVAIAVSLINLGTDITDANYAFELRARSHYGFEVVREQCIATTRHGTQSWFERRIRRGKPDFKSSDDSLKPSVEPTALLLPLIGGDQRFQPVSRFLSEMRTYRIDPVALREMQDPDSGSRLRPDGRNVASVLEEIGRRSAEDLTEILEFLEQIVPRIVDVSAKRHGNKVALEFTQEWADQHRMKFEAFNMSDGTLRALGLLVAAFQHPRPSVLLIEEPEATIHPGGLDVIADLLERAATQAQVIITTHSPELLDAKWITDRQLKIVEWQAGETRIAPLSDTSRDAIRDHLMGAGELLRANALTPNKRLFLPEPVERPLFDQVLR